jgi:hypothetical protein
MKYDLIKKVHMRHYIDENKKLKTQIHKIKLFAITTPAISMKVRIIYKFLYNQNAFCIQQTGVCGALLFFFSISD